MTRKKSSFTFQADVFTMSRRPGYGAYLVLAFLMLLVLAARDIFTSLSGAGTVPASIERAAGPEIDLNRARAGELVLVPGIGASLAREIVRKREELGGFDSVEDLLKVKGIGRDKFERLRAFVRVEGARR